MPSLSRYYIPDAVVFITGVTDRRRRYLESAGDMEVFWETLRRAREIHGFGLLAYVVLPDHFHWLMRLRDGSADFSAILHTLKRNYTLNYKKTHGITGQFRRGSHVSFGIAIRLPATATPGSAVFG